MPEVEVVELSSAQAYLLLHLFDHRFDPSLRSADLHPSERCLKCGDFAGNLLTVECGEFVGKRCPGEQGAA